MTIKKKIIIGLSVLIVLIMCVIFVLSIKDNNGDYFFPDSFCNHEGEEDGAGYYDGGFFKIVKSCCFGLKSIEPIEIISESVSQTTYNISGGRYICTKCGNGICGEYENKYNCSEDCGKPSNPIR